MRFEILNLRRSSEWADSLTETISYFFLIVPKLGHKAAEQGNALAQCSYGASYATGQGVPQDYVEAYKWYNLAAAQGNTNAIKNRNGIVRYMTSSQIAEAQRLSREYVPRKQVAPDQSDFSSSDVDVTPTATGTGFFITDDGYLISNYHVIKSAAKIRLLTSTGTISAKVVQVDEANDIALLKAVGKFSPLPVVASRGVRLGATVAMVGFPDTGLQGFSPKLAKGEIGSLAGIQDDPRYFQISAPVQPGNSGGALVDEHGNVAPCLWLRSTAALPLFDHFKFIPFSLNRAGNFSEPCAGCNTPPVAPLPPVQTFARFAGLCGNAKTKITISTTKAAEAE
jgi:hypothetical protein